MSTRTLEQRIAGLARAVANDLSSPTFQTSGRDYPSSFGVLSTGEKIAVALVLDRYDLLQACWGTMLESIDRLGDEWLRAAHRVQRDGY